MAYESQVGLGDITLFTVRRRRFINRWRTCYIIYIEVLFPVLYLALVGH